MIKINAQGLPPEYVLKLAQALSGIAPKTTGTINVKLELSERIRQLNLAYAGIDDTTDVLSFSYTESDLHPTADPALPLDLGDIIINSELAKSQAKEAKTSVDTELVLLLLHGCLHLLGFDHQTKPDQRLLDQLQQQIMSQLGLDYRNFGWK